MRNDEFRFAGVIGNGARFVREEARVEVFPAAVDLLDPVLELADDESSLDPVLRGLDDLVEVRFSVERVRIGGPDKIEALVLRILQRPFHGLGVLARPVDGEVDLGLTSAATHVRANGTRETVQKDRRADVSAEGFAEGLVNARGARRPALVGDVGRDRGAVFAAVEAAHEFVHEVAVGEVDVVRVDERRVEALVPDVLDKDAEETKDAARLVELGDARCLRPEDLDEFRVEGVRVGEELEVFCLGGILRDVFLDPF